MTNATIDNKITLSNRIADIGDEIDNLNDYYEETDSSDTLYRDSLKDRVESLETECESLKMQLFITNKRG